MKTKNYIFFAIIIIAISSCVSPEKDGLEVGTEFCNCLNGSKTDSFNTMQLDILKDSCLNATKIKYNEVTEKYNGNDEKLKLFELSYNSTIDSTLRKFDSIYTSITKNQLLTFLWTKCEEDNYKNSLYSFRTDTMRIINRKGNYRFQLNANKLSFTDVSDNANGIIKFMSLDSFYLSVIDTSKEHIIYRKASSKDSLIGRYVGNGQNGYTRQNYNFTIKPNGDFVDIGALYSYDFKNNTLILKVHGTEKAIYNLKTKPFKEYKGFRIFKLKQNMYRTRFDELNKLNFLFIKTKPES